MIVFIVTESSLLDPQIFILIICNKNLAPNVGLKPMTLDM